MYELLWWLGLGLGIFFFGLIYLVWEWIDIFRFIDDLKKDENNS